MTKKKLFHTIWASINETKIKIKINIITTIIQIPKQSPCKIMNQNKINTHSNHMLNYENEFAFEKREVWIELKLQ